MTRSRRNLALAIGLVAAIALLGWATARWSRVQADAAADVAARQAAQSHVTLLASELQKYRLLPLVLSEYPDVADALRGAGPPAIARLNATLELLAHRTDAVALYVIARDGRTIGASNWRLPTSFVGQNYGFRPYFRNAMRTGASELFALGTVSGRPGLYLARRIDRDGRALGVIVVKVEFDAVEALWAHTAGASFVVDNHGVILITSLPAWRFRTISLLDRDTLAVARETRQFGARPPMMAPVRIAWPDARIVSGGAAGRYRLVAAPAPLEGARLLHFAPLEPQLAAVRARALLWALGILLVGGFLLGLALHGIERARLHRRARAALEDEVARRTIELREANNQLILRSEERAAIDRRFRAAREELAQANRLGSLGQITAGVAHEINQPVAAIRTFAESATTLLDRAAPDRARENLLRIVDLTGRIGSITAELRDFARRKTPTRGTARLGAALDGAMLLLGERARDVITIQVSPELRAVAVTGDRIRLEQILINLLQNALEAVSRHPGGTIRVSATRTLDQIEIAVSDNGPGVDPAIRDSLFTPFTSAKPEGLGLGLAIARDIARDFGGDLHCAATGSGATFLLTTSIAHVDA